MFLTDICKNCGQHTFLGYVNEYNERFCTRECYSNYCKKHGQQEVNFNMLRPAEIKEE